MEDYIKCELTGGGSPRLLNTFSNMFDVGCTLHTNQYMLRMLLLLTAIM